METCDQMLNMIDESTAVQRHYGFTSKDLYNDDPTDYLRSSKLGNAAANYVDKRRSNPAKAEKDAYRVGKYVHSGKYDKVLDRTSSLAEKITGEKLSDRQRKENEIIAKAAGRASLGANLAKYANKSGADIKSAYDRGAAKGDKKRAIKETCEYILSVIDEIE